MLTKNDLILLLSEMEENNINVTDQLHKLMLSDGISRDVLKFINDNRPLEIANFYTLLRKNYNDKKSKLYKNLVKEDFEDPTEVLTTLAALNLQIFLYAKKLSESTMFLKQSRSEEISNVLANYCKTYDLLPCLKALKVIKADLKSFESISR